MIWCDGYFFILLALKILGCNEDFLALNRNL